MFTTLQPLQLSLIISTLSAYEVYNRFTTLQPTKISINLTNNLTNKKYGLFNYI